MNMEFPWNRTHHETYMGITYSPYASLGLHIGTIDPAVQLPYTLEPLVIQVLLPIWSYDPLVQHLHGPFFAGTIALPYYQIVW